MATLTRFVAKVGGAAGEIVSASSAGASADEDCLLPAKSLEIVVAGAIALDGDATIFDDRPVGFTQARDEEGGYRSALVAACSTEGVAMFVDGAMAAAVGSAGVATAAGGDPSSRLRVSCSERSP